MVGDGLHRAWVYGGLWFWFGVVGFVAIVVRWWLWSQVMDLWAEFDLQWGWLWVPMEWWVYYKFFGFGFCCCGFG